MLRSATAHLPQVTVERFEGLLVDYALARGARAVVRGVRGAVDLERETMIGAVYREMTGDALESVLLPARPELSFISSTVVREYIKYRRDLSRLVPPCVAERIARQYEKEDSEGKRR